MTEQKKSYAGTLFQVLLYGLFAFTIVASYVSNDNDSNHKVSWWLGVFWAVYFCVNYFGIVARGRLS